jgi:hypothetical protein
MLSFGIGGTYQDWALWVLMNDDDDDEDIDDDEYSIASSIELMERRYEIGDGEREGGE